MNGKKRRGIERDTREDGLYARDLKGRGMVIADEK